MCDGCWALFYALNLVREGWCNFAQVGELHNEIDKNLLTAIKRIERSILDSETNMG